MVLRIRVPSLGAPTSGWSTTFSTTLGSGNNGWSGYSLRQLIPAALITLSGDRIRITMPAQSVVIAKAYVGHAASAGSLDFDGTQIPLNVGGSNAFALTTGAVSDALTYALDETRDLIVSFYFSSGDILQNNSVTGANRAWVFGDDAAPTIHGSGYTDTFGTVAIVSLIEEQAATGGTSLSVALGNTEQADVPAFTAKTVILASLASTEGADVPAFTVKTVITAAMANTETADTPAFSVGFGSSVGGTLANIERADTPAFAATMGVNIVLGSTETADTPAFAGKTVLTASVASTETPDTPAIVATLGVTFAIGSTERPDTPAFAAIAGLQITFASTEPADVPAFAGNVPVSLSVVLGSVERPDVPAFDIRPPEIFGAFSSLELSDVPFFGFVSTLYSENMLTGPPKSRVLKPRF